MVMKFADYVDMDLNVRSGTTGGDTYYVGDPPKESPEQPGYPRCFTFTSSHYDAVRALTEGNSKEWTDIDDKIVDDLIVQGSVIIDESNCRDGLGYLGAEVWQDGSYIGGVGDRCGHEAGWGTEHLGYGRCKFHDGTVVRKGRITHGRTSARLREQVQQKVMYFMDNPARLSISREIAMMRGLTDVVLEMVTAKGSEMEFMEVYPDIMRSLEMIGRMVDKSSQIETRSALTASQVLYIQATMADLLNSYITDPTIREDALAHLVDRLGGQGIDMDNRLRLLEVSSS